MTAERDPFFASFFFLCFWSFSPPRPFTLIHSLLESFLSQAARSDYRGGGGRRCMGVGRRIAQRLALLPPPSLTSFPPSAELPGCCHGNGLGCGLIVPGPSSEKKRKACTEESHAQIHPLCSIMQFVPNDCRTAGFCCKEFLSVG